VRVSSASINLHGLSAGLALDIAAPVVLAVAVVTHDDGLDGVSTTAAHRLTALSPSRINLAHPVDTEQLDNSFKPHLACSLWYCFIGSCRRTSQSERPCSLFHRCKKHFYVFL